MKKCCYCGADAIIHAEAGLYYARCSKCNEHGLYTFLGKTARSATEQWNAANSEKRVVFRTNLSALTADRSIYTYEINGAEMRSLAEAGKKIGVASETIRQVFIKHKIAEGTVVYHDVRISRFLKQKNKGVKNVSQN